ncbi:hypothetical protein C4D60_Mb01t31460 [Musa balbisiana]|uniref:WRKY domain-containing protein n=1 Tax=Musa balbisiana TaxID=52838 RepID=A0A4S8JS43_MUSBA|nr:hypothetical protein C4D60_Mb01t31460 [Musa balbisiana]
MENSLIIDSVIQEMEYAFDLTNELQSLIELGSCSDRLKELVRVLKDDLLQIVRSRKKDVKPQKKRMASLDVPIRIDRRSLYARREITATPFDHDHQWRKYGEKKITGCIFSRSYYRCTYSDDQGCTAKMQVQRQTPSLFLVTHTGRHTCKTSSSTTDDDDTVKPSASHITEPFLLRFDSGDHYKMEENKSYVRKDTVQTSSGKLESADPTSCVDSLSSVALDMDFSIFDFDEIEY